LANPPRFDFSLRRRLLSPQTAISFVGLIAFVVFVVMRFDIDWRATWSVLRGADPGRFALAILVHYTTFVFRGARWSLLLANVARSHGEPARPPGMLHAGLLIHISWFANSVTWFRMGDAYRAYAYAEDTKTSFPRAAGTVLADRLVDVVVVVALMALGMGILYVGGQVRPPLVFILMAIGLLVAIVAGLSAMLFLRKWVTPRLPGRVRGAYERFHAGTMGSFGNMPLVLGLGVLGWLAEVGRLFCVMAALNVQAAPGLILFVPMANGLLSAVPLTPGGLGIVEAGISGLLRLQLAVPLALAVALADRVISYLSIVVTGGIAFAVRQVSIGKRRARESRLAGARATDAPTE